MINLDYASHTPVDDAVLAEFCRVERECHGNALAAHGAGRVALAEMERATADIAALLGVNPAEIIYTSGASEANNLAIKGIARAYAYKGKHILSTCLEHPSVSGTLAYLQESGYEIELLKIQPNGQIDLSHLKSAIRPDTILLCISAVDSELGAVQPVRAIGELLSEHSNCHLHVDAAQAMGKIPVFTQYASTLSFSPHKFYGLCGFGVLVKRHGVVLEPLIHGGGSLYRGGTPSPAMAAACFKALELAVDAMDKRLKTVCKLHQYILEGIRDINEISTSAKHPQKTRQRPLIRVNSPAIYMDTMPGTHSVSGELAHGSPYILNISVNGIRGTDFQAALDQRGIAVSVKSACSTDKSPSRPVFAVTGDRQNALSSWRVSFSHLTTTQELDSFLTTLNELCRSNMKKY